MAARIAEAFMISVLVVASCGDTGSQTSEPATTVAPTTPQSTTTSSSLSTTAANQQIEATAPPPDSFDEVVGGFAVGRDQTLELGRTVVDQFLNGQLDELYARVSDEFANFVSLEQLRTGRTDLESQAPLGEVGAERAVQLSPQTGFYAAEIAWGDGTLGLTASFGETSEITGLLLNPQPFQTEDPEAEYLSPVPFRLPFEGVWFTFWGGDTAIQNYHVVVPMQRHAFDFLIWKDGSTHQGDGTDVTDYWAYGQRVLAPAAGTLVTVVDGLPDQVPQTGSDTVNPAGNHVVIEVAPNEFILIAHLQDGSIRVEEGDVVESGQHIGLVGNSGTTSEPHIHVHLQDAPEFSLEASGLPLEFTDYLADGVPVTRNQPLADEFVANQPG